MKKFMIEAGKTVGSVVLSALLLLVACVLVPVRTMGCIADVIISMLDDASTKYVTEYVRDKMRKALD